MFNFLSKIIVNKLFTFAYFSSFQMSSKHDSRILYVYEFKLGHSAAQTTRNINTAFGESSAAESTIWLWFAKFCSGDFDLRDEEGRGRNYSTDNDELRTLVERNPQTTARELSEQLHVSISTISAHLKDIGKLKKWNKWVPHLLTKKQMEKKYEICSMLLRRNESNQFLNRIITCDEKWILYDNPKRPAEWIDRGSLQDTSQNLVCTLKRFCSQFGGLKRG